MQNLTWRSPHLRVVLFASWLVWPVTAFGQTTGAPVELVLAAERPVEVALDHRVTVRHIGQQVSGTVVQPIYVYDRIVLPVGTRVSGRVERLEPASKTRRVMGAMAGDFSPHPHVVLAFDSITVGEGPPIGIEALATGGGHRVERKVAEGAEPAPDPQGAIGRMRRTASEEAQSVVGVLKEPGKTERLQEAAINALPYHPEILSRGTVYTIRLSKPVDFGSVSPSLPASPDALPAPDSILAARLTTTVASDTASRGTPITAVLTAPVFSDQHELILPEGTLLTGEVVYSRKARHMRHNGQLRLLFLSVQSPVQAPRPLLGSMYAVQTAAGDNLVMDEEGGTRIVNPKTRFIAPAVAALAFAGSVHQEPERPDPGETFGAGEMQGNPGAQTVGGFVGFGLVGAVVGHFSRPMAIAFSAIGLARSVYSTVFAKGREVSFVADTPIQVRLAPGPTPAAK